MTNLKSFASPAVLLALAGTAVVGFAAGYLLGRDPHLLRRVFAAAAGGWEQTRLAAAEASEEIADHWAEAGETARARVEEGAFGAAAAAAATVPEAPAAPPIRKAKRPARAAASRRPARGTH